MKKKSLQVLALLFLVLASAAGAQEVDYGRFAPALTPPELGVSGYHITRDGTLLSIEIFGRDEPIAAMTIEWPGDMAGHIDFRSKQVSLSAIWHVDTGILETTDHRTGDRVVFRPSGSMEKLEATWQIEGAARSINEVRKDNRKAIELMLNAYEEAVIQLDLRPRQEAQVVVGEDLVNGFQSNCTICSGSCPTAQTTAGTRSGCCASAFGISSAACSQPACASSLCISNCLIGNTICLCTLNALFEIDLGPGLCAGEWPPPCV